MPSCFNIFDAGTRGKHVDIEALQPKKTKGVRVAANAYQTLRHTQPEDILFDRPRDKVVFGFWITCTGPMLRNYEQNGHFYDTTVPQFAWQSRAVRELLLAVVEMDEKWIHSTRKARSESSRHALKHYHNALVELRQGSTSKVETLVAAIVAWTVDSALYDYEAGLVHLRGAGALIEELELEAQGSRDHSTYDFVHNNVRSIHNRCEGYQKLLTSSRIKSEEFKGDMSDSCRRYRSMRDQMSNYLTQCRLHRLTVTEMTTFLKSWENANRERYTIEDEPSILKETLMLLPTVAWTLVPRDQAGIPTVQDGFQTLDYVLTKTALAVRLKHQLDREDREMLQETLELTMMYLFKFHADEKDWSSRRKLIEKIALQNRQIFQRTCVLEKLGLY